MGNEITVFNKAVEDQMPMLIQATGLNKQELESKLTSFAYATKAALEVAKQSITNLDVQSIREAFKASLDTGIPVDKRQLAYVIKYGNAIQYHIGFKGFISRIKEIYPTAQVKAELVYKGDTFTVEKVDGQARYTHKVANPFATTKDLAGAYAYVQYVDNGKEYSFIETMGKDEIDKIRGKAKTGMVWNEWYGEMAKKAVIRRLCKTLFIGNPRIQVLEDVDNKNFNIQEPIHIEYDKPKPMPAEVQENKADIPEEEPKEAEVVTEEINEASADNIFTIKSFVQKKGIGKNGKPYVLTTLTLDDGTLVKTFDHKEFMEGQTVELVEWDVSKAQCKSVNIL